jgi:hypothetical protein
VAQGVGPGFKTQYYHHQKQQQKNQWNKMLILWKNKQDWQTLANLTKIRRNTQINKIKHKKGEIITNTKEIQGLIRDYFENLFSNKLKNLEEMDKLLDKYDHPKLNQQDINHLNSNRISQKRKV